jgi:hypothetical protein
MSALRNLRWYDWLWCALPLGLGAVGGVFGGLCGVVAFAFNLRTFAAEQPRPLKYMIAALSTVTAAIVYLTAGLALAAIFTS